MIGIYGIRNIINNKLYIGSSINIKNRISTHKHLLITNKHHSPYLQRTFNKYGMKIFSFENIEYVENKNELIRREQVWIDYFKPEYNTNKFAENRLGSKASEETIKKMQATAIRLKLKPPSFKGKHHSKETKQKMSKIQTGTKRSKETCLNISRSKKGNKSMLGKHHSQETKMKISKAHKGRYTGENHPMWGKKHNKETKEKISLSHKGKKHTKEWCLNMSKAMKGKFNTGQFKKGHTMHNKPILQFDKNNNFIEKFESIKGAKEKLGTQNINLVCNNQRKFAGGYKWKFDK